MSAAPLDRCSIPRAFWGAAAALGAPPHVLLRQARLPATLHVTGQTLSTAQYFALLGALEDLSGDPAIGLRLVEGAPTAVHPPSTLAAFHAQDYRDGLRRLARFKRLCTPEVLNLQDCDGACTITVDWLYAAQAEPAVSVDMTFAMLIELGRRSTGHRIRPRRVNLARSKPRDPVHADYFGAPVRYNADRNALVLERVDLERPFPGHNPELLGMLTPALAAALQELDERSTIAEQVAAVLTRSLPSGRPEIEDVARELGMSGRTLQRRITDEGTSFRDILAGARRTLSRQLLASRAMAMDEIAYLLGYQDVTSFHRAFRAWEGVPPSQWRDLQDADDGARSPQTESPTG